MKAVIFKSYECTCANLRLRRLKQVLQQLPAKEEKIEFCPMTEKQRALYQALFKKLKRSTTGESKNQAAFSLVPEVQVKIRHC